MNTTKCPTCNAPSKMTWSGLDLVAETGDETLASKHYEFEPTEISTVLAGKRPIIIELLKEFYTNNRISPGETADKILAACGKRAEAPDEGQP